MSVYEIIGYIQKVTEKAKLVGEYKAKKEVVPAKFIVQTTATTTFNCVCPYFIPVEEGDVIQGRITPLAASAAKLFQFVREPLIQIPTDEANIKQCFVRALRTTGFGGVSADRLYSGLLNMAKINKLIKGLIPLDEVSVSNAIPENIEAFSQQDPTKHLLLPGFQESSSELKLTSNDLISYLTELSVNFNKSNDKSIPDNIAVECNLKNSQAQLLLQWWYKERLLRRLRLLGLTNDEIKACHMSLDDIYRICIGEGPSKQGNPFKLPPIPMEKCYAIMRFLNIEPSPIEIKSGQIVRKIYEMQTTFGWTCTPIWILQRQFSNFHIFRDIITRDYDVTIEYDSAYLKYPYLVESTVATYIDRLIKTTADKLNEVPLVDLPHLETAIYTCKTLTDEQKIAIQGALNSDISIITGGSGTGKCLAPDTEVLMFNGTIKIARDVVTGDFLMGPDSIKRTVIGVTAGKGQMFEIIPDIGKSFTCNADHILTLIGMKPIIKCINSDTWTLKYTKRGHLVNKKFTDKNWLENEVKNLVPDIFDISLRDYHASSNVFKQNVYLFHVGVDFPELDVYLGPYTLGLTVSQNNTGSIPKEYKYNSYDIRMMFLAGFIDGTYQACSDFYTMTLRSQSLCDDIEYIAYSLGFMVHCPVPFVLQISGDLEKLPTLLTKKSQGDPRSVCRPFTIKSKGFDEFNGFELSGDGRFLLGDFTVCHNSTIIGEIVKNLELRECAFAIGSPTGKSASRINEILGKKTGQTLDRMIAKRPDTRFPYLVIDETSMVTTELFYRFIDAFTHNFRIVIVGDINQLQPIGWGSFMKHLLICKRIPTYYLNYNHRIEQHITTAEEHKSAAEGGKFARLILDNANRLIDPDRNLGCPLVFEQGKGFSFIDGDIKHVSTIVEALKKAGIKADDITVLSPFNQFINDLNEIFRNVYFKGIPIIMGPDKVLWYIGARAMMLVNNYDINVMNGEEGTVVDINDKGISIKFKDGAIHLFKFQSSGVGTWRNRTYKNMTNDGEATGGGVEEDKNELLYEHIQISFAISVHKSQGSEVKYVIFYIPQRYGNGKYTMTASFLTINLLYTGITRTKKAIWMVGDENSLMPATCRVQSRRYENLSARLLALKDPEKESKIFQMNDIKVPEKVVEQQDELEQFDDDQSIYEQFY